MERAAGEEGRGSGVDGREQGWAAQPGRGSRESIRGDGSVADGSTGEAAVDEGRKEDREGGGGGKRDAVKAVVGVVVAAVYYAVWATIVVVLG